MAARGTTSGRFARFWFPRARARKRRGDKAVKLIMRSWERVPHVLICETTRREAIRGECPIHGGDGCLFVYVKLADMQVALLRYDE
jgi:hypothetical protein